VSEYEVKCLIKMFPYRRLSLNGQRHTETQTDDQCNVKSMHQTLLLSSFSLAATKTTSTAMVYSLLSKLHSSHNDNAASCFYFGKVNRSVNG